ncbi:srs domain-containing protein [Cystoisospora suis]|uniref:Srs domain-containing protein n=1 Tax=Cystoisospora suis TaxID=483139 RepID=A0A2C6L909_9APIC|nr:srs domain-containing protein [Cystoisospora suis]
MSHAEGLTLRRYPGGKIAFGSSFQKMGPVFLVALFAYVSCQIGEAVADPGSSAGGEPAKNSVLENQVATCTAPTQRAVTPEILSASISEAANTLTLNCSGGEENVAVPSTLVKGTVCAPVTDNTVETCEAAVNAKEQSKTIEVKQLLGTQENIVWTSTGTSSKSYKLTIGKGFFPYVDKKFFVGCKKSTQFACRVDVTVMARASAVSGNVATCAYGEASNASALEVRMTPEKNTFTLVCGTEGSSRPEESKFKSEFCAGTDVVDCSTTSTYGSILPGFRSEWWTPAAQGGPEVLTIPPENFPEKEQTFLVGCIPRASTDSKTKTTGACKVKVTVAAKQGTSSSVQTSYVSVGFYVAVLARSLSMLF